jgi:hypothetical protein
MPGEMLLEIFSEFKGVMLSSQDHLSKTNKQAVTGFYFCIICNFELQFLRGEEQTEMVMVCYKAIAIGTSPGSYCNSAFANRAKKYQNVVL